MGRPSRAKVSARANARCPKRSVAEKSAADETLKERSRCVQEIHNRFRAVHATSPSSNRAQEDLHNRNSMTVLVDARARSSDATTTTTKSSQPHTRRGVVYAPTSAVREPRNAHVYCARFCTFASDARMPPTFATCAGTHAEVYECVESDDAERAGVMKCVASFEVDDDDGKESLYACEWCWFDDLATAERRKAPRTTCLALAGEGAVVRIINCMTGALHLNLIGHGGTVNEVRAHPSRGDVLASASKDLSVRLWSVKTGVTIAIFAGSLGHRNEVLSVDIQHSFRDGVVKLVSGAMDNAVKVWTTPALSDVVDKATTWDEPLANFKTIVVDTPVFSSTRVHADYVDCVGWLGDAVLSKSVDGEVKLWVPDAPNGVVHARGSQFRLLSSFPLKNANLWWIRFGISAARNVLACGNMKGEVACWRLDDDGALTRNPQRLASHPIGLKPRTHEFAMDGPATVRQCTISPDGQIIVAACDQGLICRYDVCYEDEDEDEDED